MEIRKSHAAAALVLAGTLAVVSSTPSFADSRWGYAAGGFAAGALVGAAAANANAGYYYGTGYAYSPYAYQGYAYAPSYNPAYYSYGYAAAPAYNAGYVEAHPMYISCFLNGIVGAVQPKACGGQ